MSLYRDEGVVLRTHRLGEADRIVTILTRRHGRIRAVAKGVRRTKSKFGARLEPFSHVDCQYFEGRNLDIVTQAESIDAFGDRLGADYGAYTAGTAMLEAAERLTAEEREPALKMYLLLVGGLKALNEGEHPSTSILDSFLLRALAVSGYSPALDDCAKCGMPGPHSAFAVSHGGSVCRDCRPPGSSSPSAQTMRQLIALLEGDWQVADAADDRTCKEASGLIAAYFQWHTERDLRSLRMVERPSSVTIESA